MQIPFQQRKIWIAAALAAVLFFGLNLRLSSLDWGLPFRLHPDEWKYVSAGANCHRGEWNPKYFRNPPGFSYLNALWYPLWLKVRTPVEVPDWLGIDSKWLKPHDDVESTFLYRPFDLMLGGRVLSATLGALTSLLVFMLAWEWLPARYALGAAWLAAVSFANVRESHFAVNDAAATCVIFASLWLGARAFRTGGKREWYGAAVLAGIAVAFKYNAFPAVIALMGLRGLRFGFSEKEDRPWWAIRDVTIIGAISVLCFLSICPFPLADPKTFGLEMEKLRQAASQPWQGQDTRWAGLQLAETICISEGWFAAIFALAGLAASIHKQRWEMLAFPFLYGLLVCSHRLYFVRFSLPLLPWMSIWAAAAVYWLVERLRPTQREGEAPGEPSPKRFASWGLVLGFFALSAVEPILNDLRGNALLKQTDTRIEFMRWLRTQERSKAFVAVDQFSIPLVYRDVADFWTAPFDPRIVYIDSLSSDELDRMDALSEPVNWIAVSDFVTLPGYLEDSYEERRAALQDFAGSAEPARVFQPFEAGWTPKPADSEDAYSPFRNLWNRRSPGPVIELYAIEAGE